MLADGPQVQERQTKRNGKILAALIFAAAAGIAGAWLLEQNIQLRKPNLQWLETEGPQLLTVSDELAVWADLEQIQVRRLDGTNLYGLEIQLEDPVAVTAGDQILVYTPGGTALTRLDKTSGETWNIATGIDAAAVSRDGQMAVITAASGCLSVVELRTAQGAILETRAMAGAAAAMVTFLADNTLAICYVTEQGQWILETDREVELSAAVVYEMQPCGDGVALWTSDGITRYDRAGNLLGQLSLGSEQVRMWACGDSAAAVIWQTGGYRLVMLSEDGEISQSDILWEVPQDIAVWKSFAALLDSREVLIYDNRCDLRTRSFDGARACGLWAVSGGFRMSE
jgi:hypothetical protein